jgi:hypothetical protein
MPVAFSYLLHIKVSMAGSVRLLNLQNKSVDQRPLTEKAK